MELLDSQHADELATLLALHAQGSFAAAGRVMNRHPSVLSKRLGALESRLGVRLVERTTRQLRFTDDGVRLVEKVRHATLLIAEEWRLTRDGVTETVPIRGTLISNDNEALLAAARLGLGIMAAGDWLVSPDIAAGHLVPVLEPWGMNAHAGIYLVRPSAQFSTAAMAAFRQWMAAQFSQGAPWRE